MSVLERAKTWSFHLAEAANFSITICEGSMWVKNKKRGLAKFYTYAHLATSCGHAKLACLLDCNQAWIPALEGCEEKVLDMVLGLSTRNVFEAYWVLKYFSFDFTLSNTHILVCNVVLIFRPGLLPSSAQPPAFFGPSLAPPRCLFLYSHVHSYACSCLDVLILQTSFPFHKKKITRQRCKL